MALGTGAILAGGAILGGLVGSQGQKQSSSSSSSVSMAPASQTEKNATQSIDDIFKQLQGFTSAMPGEQDIQNGTNSQRDLASMLKEFAAGNYGPTAQDQETARMQTQPQQVALQQSLRDAEIQQQRQAGLMGRGGNDFTFRNKLNLGAQDAYQMLGAQQSSIASQQPFQRLGFQQQLASVQGGLATQALQNRTALLSMGQQIQAAERNFRLGAATRNTTGDQTSGGGTAGMITGAIGGAGSAFGLANMFGGAGGASSGGAQMFGGGAPSPYSGNNYLGGAQMAQQFAQASPIADQRQSRLGGSGAFNFSQFGG